MSNNEGVANSGDGVLSIRHPRSDWPQDGWISYVTRTRDIPPFIAPCLSETNSYRPPDRRAVQRNYVLYPDAQEQWWVSFTPVITPYIAKQDWHIDTVITGKREWHTSDYPRTDWLYTSLPAVFDPALQDWYIKTERTTNPQHVRKLHWDAGLQDTNWFVGSSPVFRNWVIPTTRTPQRDLSPRPTEQRLDWNTVNLQPGTNPAINDWHVDTTRTTQRDRQPQLSDHKVEWMVAVLPAFRDWGIPTVRTEDRRVPQTYRSWLADQENWTAPFTPAITPPIVQQDWHIKTAQTGKRGWYANDFPGVDWAFSVTAVPPFDPTQQSWPILGLRSDTNRRPNQVVFVSIDVMDLSWSPDAPTNPGTTAFPRLRPIAPIMSARRRNRRIRR